MKARLEKLQSLLINNTVLGNWFSPAMKAMEKVRQPRKKFYTLSMPMHILQNCMRQLSSTETQREHLQNLLQIDDEAERIPLAKSTYSDALSNQERLDITERVSNHLAEAAVQTLPDRLEWIEDIKGRQVYAIDGTYQTESSHYKKLTPSQGGADNTKGHMHVAVFDLRAGIPINTDIDTSSIAEIRFVKENVAQGDLTSRKNSLWIADRAFIDAPYWDMRKRCYNVTLITRMKANLIYTVVEKLKVTASGKKQGVKTDQLIQLDSSEQRWRLIGYKSDSGEYYEYLTNDLTLKPGVIAFLYHRRWDEEKYFDNYKNDMANAKAWGKSDIAIKQQAIIGMITYILTRLFSHKYAKQFNLPIDGSTQEKRHEKKQEGYFNGKITDPYRAFHTNLSKVTKQVWRFLKGCMLKKSRQKLYQSQLKLLMTAYI